MSHCGGCWVQVGVRRLRSPKAAGILYANPCCIAEAACRKAPAPRATSLPTLGAVRCASGASYAGGIRGVQPRLVSSASPAPSSLRVLRNVPAVLPSWSFFSTSTNSNSKEQSGSTPDKERDEDVPIAEADVAEVDKLTKQEPRHAHIEMPSITEAERTATLISWHVQVGDAIEVGDVVCEIELEHFHVGVKVETPGFLAEILVEAGTEGVPVGADIGTIVHSEEDIALYQQAQGSQAPPASEEQEVASELEESFSWKDVLKHVLRLRNDNKLSEVEASDLMALARNKDVELLQAFEGCFDGEFQGEIDYDLFLAQAKYIAKTRRKA